jgi:hypothetical protein
VERIKKENSVMYAATPGGEKRLNLLPVGGIAVHRQAEK